MEINNNKKEGLSTKQVALKLEVSERWLQIWAKTNGIQTKLSSVGGRPSYIWFQEDIIKAIIDIPKVASEPKQELAKRYITEGIVVAKTTNLNIIKAQQQTINNLIDNQLLQEREVLALREETSAMQLELEDQKETLQSHIDNEPLQDSTMATIRDLIHTVKQIKNLSIWHELHQEFRFSKLGRISEIKGRTIVEHIKNKYFY